MTSAPSPANAGALVGRQLGKFEILALLALGGTAEIYLARIGGEAGFEKYVVVKCLHDHLADDAEFVRMFLDEARLGAQLDHSNIVQTLELGEEDGRYYMVMEYLAGMSLALIARRARQRLPSGRIPVDIVLGLTAQACAGLHYAHQRNTTGGDALNIVHRDVSPQNLVVSFEGVLKIVDFGIAKADVRETKTKSGTIKGKFAYMSPEQCLAQDVDRRTDIFALGTLLHELLTGKRLFKRNSTYDTYQAIVQGQPPTPSSVNHELDPALDETVMRAIAYKKEDRYATAEDFGQALLSTLHRRGKSINASDVARFFEQYFNQEIEEHATRMRELISGRRATTMDDLAWDVTDGESDVAAKMPDDRPETIDAPSPQSASGAEAVPQVVDEGWTAPTAVEGGDSNQEIEGESTRIELNPLERVQKLHEQQERMDRATTVPATGRSKSYEDGRKTVDLAAEAERVTAGGHAAAEEEDDATSVQQPAARRKLATPPRGHHPPASSGKRDLRPKPTLRGVQIPKEPSPSDSRPTLRSPRPPLLQPTGPSARPRGEAASQERAPGGKHAPTSGPQAKTLYGAAAPRVPLVGAPPPAGARKPAAAGPGTRGTRDATPRPTRPTGRGTTPAPQPAQPSTTPAPQMNAPSTTPAPQVSAPSTTPPPQMNAPSTTPAPQMSAPSTTPAPQMSAPSTTPPPQMSAPSTTPPPQMSAPSTTPAPSPQQPDGSTGAQPPRAAPVPGRAPGPPGEAFPPLHTPSAFKQRAELLAEAELAGVADAGAGARGDLDLLQGERKTGPSAVVLVVAFLLSVGVGFGATYFIATQL